MLLCGVYETEKIVVHPDDAPHSAHYIEIEKDKDHPLFYVTYCCDEDWGWAFRYSKTNYEIIKYSIMDCIAECRTMDELIDALDEVFEEECVDMVFNEVDLQEEEVEFETETEVEWECDGDCENCSFNEDKYLN